MRRPVSLSLRYESDSQTWSTEREPNSPRCMLHTLTVSSQFKSTPSAAPLADVRNNLSEIVDEIDRTDTQLVITKHGQPVAVILVERRVRVHSSRQLTS